MTSKTKKELEKAFIEVQKKLSNPNVSEKYLDRALTIITEQLSINPNIKESCKIELKNQLKTLNEIKALNENESNFQKAVNFLKTLYYFNEAISDKKNEVLLKKAQFALDIIKKYDSEFSELMNNEDDDFIEFLNNIMNKKHNTDTYKIINIGDIETNEKINKIELERNFDKDSDEDWIIKSDYYSLETIMKILDDSDYYAELNNNQIEIDGLSTSGNDKEVIKLEKYINRRLRNTNERLLDYFKDTKDKILNKPSSKENWELGIYVKGAFYQSLVNTQNPLSQSQLNNIKNLENNNGYSLYEAVHKVIKNKDKRNQIKNLVNFFKDKETEINENQSKLYK